MKKFLNLRTVLPFLLLLATRVAAQDLQLGVIYTCGGERLYLESCNIRDLSDTATCQVALHGRNRGVVGSDEAVLGNPASRGHVGKRALDARVNLLRGHTWRQRWIRKVHRCRIETYQ